ncbi:MAG: type II toxin-antitoxin system prevent-host-death family antitoxin [Candidatus Sumerlaeaceae bacterium]|nr:type II toxin-antitoxin system prevent-host-death family antitoxin [Candidatus Sumerlaeaceae bacterium]
MKPTTIPVSRFKAECLGLFEEIARNGSQLVITKRGKPIARIMPISEKRPPLFGSWQGIVETNGDIVNFDVRDDWESNR